MSIASAIEQILFLILSFSEVLIYARARGSTLSVGRPLYWQAAGINSVEFVGSRWLPPPQDRGEPFVPRLDDQANPRFDSGES
jgi:hypothetical protein